MKEAGEDWRETPVYNAVVRLLTVDFNSKLMCTVLRGALVGPHLPRHIDDGDGAEGNPALLAESN